MGHVGDDDKQTSSEPRSYRDRTSVGSLCAQVLTPTVMPKTRPKTQRGDTRTSITTRILSATHNRPKDSPNKIGDSEGSFVNHIHTYNSTKLVLRAATNDPQVVKTIIRIYPAQHSVYRYLSFDTSSVRHNAYPTNSPSRWSLVCIAVCPTQ